MSCPLGDRQPEIEYPCEWGYRVIGSDENALRAAIVEIFGGRDHTVTFANRSRTGKYCSLEIRVFVVDEADRTGLSDRLGRHPDVRVLL